MIIKLKTKETLLKEGWAEDNDGSLVNSDFGSDVGYYPSVLMYSLGREFRVIHYLMHFYVVGTTLNVGCLYIPKPIVAQFSEESENNEQN